MRIASRLVVLLSLCSTPLAAQKHLPGTAADPAPAVAGLRLGALRAAVGASLGVPSDSQVTPAFTVLTFSTRGVVVRLTRTGAVDGLYLTSPTAGAVGGVKVGDARAEVTARWGPPTATQGANAAYVLPRWNIVVQWDPSGKRVAQIAVSTTG